MCIARLIKRKHEEAMIDDLMQQSVQEFFEQASCTPCKQPKLHSRPHSTRSHSPSDAGPCSQPTSASAAAGMPGIRSQPQGARLASEPAPLTPSQAVLVHGQLPRSPVASLRFDVPAPSCSPHHRPDTDLTEQLTCEDAALSLLQLLRSADSPTCDPKQAQPHAHSQVSGQKGTRQSDKTAAATGGSPSRCEAAPPSGRQAGALHTAGRNKRRWQSKQRPLQNQRMRLRSDKAAIQQSSLPNTPDRSPTDAEAVQPECMSMHGQDTHRRAVHAGPCRHSDVNTSSVVPVRCSSLRPQSSLHPSSYKSPGSSAAAEVSMCPRVQHTQDRYNLPSADSALTRASPAMTQQPGLQMARIVAMSEEQDVEQAALLWHASPFTAVSVTVHPGLVPSLDQVGPQIMAIIVGLHDICSPVFEHLDAAYALLSWELSGAAQ